MRSVVFLCLIFVVQFTFAQETFSLESDKSMESVFNSLSEDKSVDGLIEDNSMCSFDVQSDNFNIRSKKSVVFSTNIKAKIEMEFSDSEVVEIRIVEFKYLNKNDKGPKSYKWTSVNTGKDKFNSEALIKYLKNQYL